MRSCFSDKKRLLDELGFEDSADDDNGGETSSAGEDIMSSSSEQSDEQEPERDRHHNRLILSGYSFALRGSKRQVILN